MQTVKIKRNELYNAVTKNLTQHKKDLHLAKKERRQKIVDRMNIEIAKILEDGDYQPPTNVSIVQVPDHSGDYQRVIRMVDMSVEDVIELTAREFDQYIMDNWNWKDIFNETIMSYK